MYNFARLNGVEVKRKNIIDFVSIDKVCFVILVYIYKRLQWSVLPFQRKEKNMNFAISGQTFIEKKWRRRNRLQNRTFRRMNSIVRKSNESRGKRRAGDIFTASSRRNGSVMKTQNKAAPKN